MIRENCQEIHVDGHKLVALNLNPDAPADRPIIVLLHGLTASVKFWLTDHIFQKYGRCYSLSLPGHYPARFPRNFSKDDLTGEMLINVLTRAINELTDGKPVTLVGHSTGGFVALGIAIFNPEIVRRVVCVSSFFKGDLTGIFGLNQKLARSGRFGKKLVKIGYDNVRNRTLFTSSLRFYVGDPSSFFSYSQIEEFINYSYRDFNHLNIDSMVTYFEAIHEIKIDLSLLKKITVPTLILVGTRDPIVSPSQSDLIASRIPDSQLVKLAGAGHLLFAERPKEYNLAIEDWLNKTK